MSPITPADLANAVTSVATILSGLMARLTHEQHGSMMMLDCGKRRMCDGSTKCDA